MSTTSIKPFPRYTRENVHKFAHFGKGDAEVFSRFLKSQLSEKYLGFDYDIKVGKFAVDALDNPTPEAKLQSGTLAKRIDVVAFRSLFTLDIIEVKANKIHSAVGQILAYQRLFKNTYTDLIVEDLVIITAFRDQELIEFAESQDIKVFVLE